MEHYVKALEIRSPGTNIPVDIVLPKEAKAIRHMVACLPSHDLTTRLAGNLRLNDLRANVANLPIMALAWKRGRHFGGKFPLPLLVPLQLYSDVLQGSYVDAAATGMAYPYTVKVILLAEYYDAATLTEREVLS